MLLTYSLRKDLGILMYPAGPIKIVLSILKNNISSMFGTIFFEKVQSKHLPDRMFYDIMQIQQNLVERFELFTAFEECFEDIKIDLLK